ncbi:MAG TPA: SDR family oxidoreductase [Noviherbaspirillum sp.]|uniref:SDR family oxidoreductase n=1 Tax=Noviherbaspirillum sp. TaxID=1926288 RepID=UPI002B49D80E|nr:SDR family oxidoreductase [Noviherbaspirillum sp.]HJV87696.1 SDR family oxidoreductase [Noviherbaspirillum sp.]
MKAILTGHARGLGAAIAEDLLERGIGVLGIARHGNTSLASRFPTLLEQITLDLSDTGAVAGWLAGDTLKRYLAGSKTSLLINNAGIVQPVGPMQAQDIATIGHAVSLNVAAPLMLASAFTEASSDAADRRIVHISSGAGRSVYPGWSVYCATKAALDHHARVVVLDQTPNLRICSLAPGVIDTDMQAEIRATALEQFPLRERFEALKRTGSLADPRECARRLVDYLLDDGFGQSPVADLRDRGS